MIDLADAHIKALDRLEDQPGTGEVFVPQVAPATEPISQADAVQLVRERLVEIVEELEVAAELLRRPQLQLVHPDLVRPQRGERRRPHQVLGLERDAELMSPRQAWRAIQAASDRVPLLAGFMETLLNCSIACRLRSPVLMPHPYGIVIDRNAVLGSRVTVMHQVTIGARHPADAAAPVIEDNVFIGAGARILGAVRIGRHAVVGANAVVTRDVPSHCTVVGVNRILGAAAVVGERQAGFPAVVNT